jgi:zinc protease
VIIGNIDANDEKLKQFICTYIASLPSRPSADKINDLGLRPVKGKVRQTVYRGLEDKATVYMIYHGSFPYTPEEKLVLEALNTVLENKLVVRLREKEAGVYSPHVYTSKERIPDAYYKVQVSFNCSVANTEKLIQAVREEIADIKTKGITTDELLKFQTETQRQMELRVRENNFWLSYIKSVYTGDVTESEYLTYADRAKKLTPEQLKRAAQMYLSEDNVATVVLLPEEK